VHDRVGRSREQPHRVALKVGAVIGFYGPPRTLTGTFTVNFDW